MRVTPAEVRGHPGQAHFPLPGGTGACGNCACFPLTSRNEVGREGVCSLAKELFAQMKRKAAPIPRDARACKYFTARERKAPWKL